MEIAEALKCCASLVWVCDADGRLTYTNFDPSAAGKNGKLGATLETLLPMVAPKDRQDRARELRCALLDRTSRTHQFRAEWGMGRQTSIQEEVTPLWKDGVFSGLVGLGSPISTAPYGELDWLQLGTLNHEVRNCLTGILGTLQLLRDGDLQAEQSDRLGAAQQSCETLLGLVQDSLEAHKMRVGMGRLKSVSFSLHKLTRSVLLSLEKMAAEHGAKTKLVFPSDVPKFVQGDPGRVSQILTNLLSNAFQYSEEGLVTLRLSKAGDGIEFQVKDRGPGIDTHVQKVMFGGQPLEFEQGPVISGRGLGLGISHTLASLLGGRLGCHSDVRGTSFELWLPLVAARPPAFASPRGKVKTPKSKLHALIVEDQDLVAQALVGQLRKLGVSTSVAIEGEEALGMLEARLPDLIFLDLHLVGGSGYAISREIRRRHGDKPVVVGLTGDTAKGVRRRCLESGMNDCVFKPMSFRRLTELLQQFSGTGERSAEETELRTHAVQ